MSDKVCIVVGAGEKNKLDFVRGAEDMVVAADGGYGYLSECGIKADVVVGDFDSLKGGAPEGIKTVKLNAEKDTTDTAEAINIGRSNGYKNFLLYCCGGGRIAHTLANIQQLIGLANEGCRGYIVTDDTVMTVIKNASLVFPADAQGYISVFALSTAPSKVTLEGLKYPLNKYPMHNGFPIGVSNEFNGEAALVKVVDGLLLLVYPKKINFLSLI